jgi:hypothetical protein
MWNNGPLAAAHTQPRMDAKRLSSCRSVFFNCDQLFWECRSNQYLECSALDMSLLPVDRIYSGSSPNFMDSLRTLESLRYLGSAKSQPPKEKAYRHWYAILSEFKRRKFSYIADAFAREFWELRNTNYFRLSLLVGAWAARNFSAQHAGSLGYLSDCLSPNALSPSATKHEVPAHDYKLNRKEFGISQFPKFLCKGIPWSWTNLILLAYGRKMFLEA